MKPAFWRGLPHVWGSSGGSRGRVGVVRWREPLPEGGAEGAVVDSAADLQQEIGPPSGPAHLLRLVHSTVHQEVGRPLGDGGPDPQAGTVTLGVVDGPVSLADQIAVQRQQRRPQLPRGRNRPAAVGLALEVVDDGADALDAGLGILRLVFIQRTYSAARRYLPPACAPHFPRAMPL